MIMGASTTIGNLIVTTLEVVCVTSRDDDVLTTVAVMLIGLPSAPVSPFAVIVTMSLVAEPPRTAGSSATKFPRTTLVVAGYVNSCSAMRVSVSPGSHSPLSPAPSALAASVAFLMSSYDFAVICDVVPSVKAIGPRS